MSLFTDAPLVIRADADSSMGTGHVMRCLAIAQEWQARGRRVLLLYRSCPQALIARLEKEGVLTLRLEADNQSELAVVAERFPVALLLVDGYHFVPEYRRLLSALFSPVVVLDDSICHWPLYADCIINPQPGAREEDYLGSGAQELLLGPNYLPLRREFCVATDTDREGQHILVTLGGTDPAGLTLPVVRALLASLPPEAHLDVVISAQHTDCVALQEQNTDVGRVTLWHDVENMADLMERAGIAVTAAGSTVWELAALRVPAVTVIVADNQRVIAGYPYWPETVDVLGLPVQTAASLIAEKATALYADGSRRRHYRDKLATLSLGHGSQRICDGMEQLLAKREK